MYVVTPGGTLAMAVYVVSVLNRRCRLVLATPPELSTHDAVRDCALATDCALADPTLGELGDTSTASDTQRPVTRARDLQAIAVPFRKTAVTRGRVRPFVR